MQYFQKELPQKVEQDSDGLFNLAFQVKINTKKMKKMEKEYADLRKKEQEEMVELRVRSRIFENYMKDSDLKIFKSNSDYVAKIDC